MTDLIVRQEIEIQKPNTQNKALMLIVPDDGLFSEADKPRRIDWFTQTELYRLGLRRKEGDE